MGPLQSNLAVRDGAAVINHAIALGINFIDTAQIYKTYPYIKAALDLQSTETKNNVIISTKTYAHTRKLAKEALDEALRELGRDYIDIFLLHEQESIHTIYGHLEALEYLFEQKESGRIRAVGISTHHVSGVWGALEFNRTYNKNKLEVIHPMYNITGLGILARDDSDDNPVLQMEAALTEAERAGFFIFSMKPLGGGNLYARAEESLNFSLSKPFIDSVAVGMKSLLEVEANVNLLKTGRFTDEYYKHYLGGKHLHIDYWCGGCGKCVESCAANALEVSKSSGRVVCDPEKCVLCGYCSAACGSFALKII